MTRPPNKKKQRKPRQRPGPRARAAHILDELRALSRDLAIEEGVDRRETLPFSELDLPISLNLQGGKRGDDLDRLLVLIRDKVRASLKARNSFRMGRVYCFRCDLPDCEHSAPAETNQVFSGYQATGKPAFKDFLQVAMDAGWDGVEHLYETPPDVIARVQTAPELKGELLPGFGKGSRTYNVLGQVIIGWAPPRLGPDPDPASRLALTFQLVETHGGDRHRRVRLNFLGLSLDHLAQLAAEEGYRSQPERLSRIIRTTREHLERQGRRLLTMRNRGDQTRSEDVLLPILNRLRSDLESLLRPRKFRTQHAESRHRGGDRPTSLALQDALSASTERTFLDTHADTGVVIGPRNRAHAFTREGRHVTSLILEPGEIERKTGKGRWRPCMPEEADGFRRSLSRKR
jgi:hypothetical protein